MSSISKYFLKRLNEDPEYYDFWEDMDKYCKDFEIPDKKYFVDSLPILFEKIKNDGAGYSIHESLRKFALEKPEEAIEVLKMIEQKDSLETLNFSSSILSGLSQGASNYPFKDKILSFINSSNENKINSGITTAYQVNINNKDEEVKFLNQVHVSLTKVIESNSSKNLGIITRFYNKHINTIEGAKEIIIELLHQKKADVQIEVARSLNEEFKLKEDPIYFKKCLNLLSFTEVKYHGIYNIIKYRLNDIIVSHPNIIIEFINHWIANNIGSLKGISVLKEIVHELYVQHPKTIEKLFLDWLNSDNSSCKMVLQFVISDLSYHIDTVGLPKESLKKLSETDSLYIVYMIVGYILDRKYATEMLYNILEVNFKNERIRNKIAAIFINYLIRNYYSVTDILEDKKKKANKIITSIIDQIIDASEQYYKQVSDLELINEFEPSDKRMDYFYKQQNIQMQKLMDESETKSNSFLNTVSNIGLRAGKFFFTKYRGEYSQEMELQNFRSSIEIARVQFIDDIGQMKLRLIWQNKKRDELPN